MHDRTGRHRYLNLLHPFEAVGIETYPWIGGVVWCRWRVALHGCGNFQSRPTIIFYRVLGKLGRSANNVTSRTRFAVRHVVFTVNFHCSALMGEFKIIGPWFTIDVYTPTLLGFSVTNIPPSRLCDSVLMTHKPWYNRQIAWRRSLANLFHVPRSFPRSYISINGKFVLRVMARTSSSRERAL